MDEDLRPRLISRVAPHSPAGFSRPALTAALRRALYRAEVRLIAGAEERAYCPVSVTDDVPKRSAVPDPASPALRGKSRRSILLPPNQGMWGNVGKVGLLVRPRTLPAALQGSGGVRRPPVSGPKNWGDPDGRYRNTRSVSRGSVHSGRLLRVLHRARSQRARRGGPGTGASRLAGSGCGHNAGRHMADALHRHPRLPHAGTH